MEPLLADLEQNHNKKEDLQNDIKLMERENNKIKESIPNFDSVDFAHQKIDKIIEKAQGKCKGTKGKEKRSSSHGII